MPKIIAFARTHVRTSPTAITIERQLPITYAFSMALHLARRNRTTVTLQAAVARCTRAESMLKHSTELACAHDREG